MIRRRDAFKTVLGGTLAASTKAATAKSKPKQPLDYVLVHGTWLGVWIWKDVVPLLHKAGHPAHAVTLTGTGERFIKAMAA